MRTKSFHFGKTEAIRVAIRRQCRHRAKALFKAF